MALEEQARVKSYVNRLLSKFLPSPNKGFEIDDGRKNCPPACRIIELEVCGTSKILLDFIDCKNHLKKSTNI